MIVKINEYDLVEDHYANLVPIIINSYDRIIDEESEELEGIELYVNNLIPYFFAEDIGMRKLKTEQIYCISLLDDYQPDGFINIGNGSKLKAKANFKKMWTYLLMHQHKKFCLIHNHPNNSPAASQADLQSNQIASYLGSMMSLEFVEHIIITPSYYNLTIKGLQNGGEINEWAY